MSLLDLATRPDSEEPPDELDLTLDEDHGTEPHPPQGNEPPIGGGDPPTPVPPPAPNSGPDDENYSGWRLEIRKNGILYLLYFYSAIFVLLFVTSLFFSTWTLPLWLPVLVAAGCFVYYTYEQVTPRVHVLLTLAGMIVLPLDGKKHLVPGPHLIPPLVKMITYPNTQIFMVFGTAEAGSEEEASMNELLRNNPNAALYWDKQAVRISWRERGAGQEGEARRAGSLAGVLTTDPPLYAIAQLRIPEDYYLVVGESIEEGLARIRVIMVRALQEIAGYTSSAMALETAAEINAKLKAAVEDLVADPQAIARNAALPPEKRKALGKSWGLDIIDAAFVTPGFSHDVNIALGKARATVTEADATAEATVTTSLADKTAARNKADAALYTTVKEGEGQKAKTIAIGEGEADSLRKKGAAASTRGGRLVLQTEALSRAVENGNVTLMPIDTGGLTSFATAIAAGQQVFEANKNKPKEKE
ncbi:MAG: hypothetical protein AB198_00755 [Parcubacteria bacterium C7867-003]|nr:MAG: hypothetical protein AB198_00755 [Parcubacteria bacterium C7867-003]